MFLRFLYWKLRLCSYRSIGLYCCCTALLIFTATTTTNLRQQHKQYSSQQLHHDINTAATLSAGGSDLFGTHFNPIRYITSVMANHTHPMIQYQFNITASDNIGYTRTLWDVRNPMCHNKQYEVSSVTVSVIVCFHNEARSALLRTIHSVLQRTPSDLLEEILLIDDASANVLDGQLLQYIPKVRVIRLDSRQGLIRARLEGTRRASGRVLAYLDSHCEATVGWLEPLVATVIQYRNRIASPVIDIIHKSTMKYVSAKTNIKGGFGHDLYFKWIKLSSVDVEKRRRDPTTPITTPAIAGGLFVVDRQFFNEIGTYDEKMDIWGGENVELSMRVWMCGGGLEIVPCSRVGHVFRSTMPYGFGKGRTYFNTVMKNLRRTAEVWMGNDKQLFYNQIPKALTVDYGSIGSRLDLKRNLHCKSFPWYINNIYPEFRSNYTSTSYYQFMQWGVGCITLQTEGRVLLRSCEIIVIGPSSPQVWEVSDTGQLKHFSNACLSRSHDTLVVEGCNHGNTNQLFNIIKTDTNRLKIQHSRSCLDRIAEKELQFNICNTNTTSQVWTLRKLV